MAEAAGAAPQQGEAERAKAKGAARRAFARIRRQSSVVAKLLGEGGGRLDTHAEAVSAWSVAQQLEHLLLVERSVLAQIHRLLDARQLPPLAGINLLGRTVLATGFMPRGVAKAPGGSLPAAAAARAAAAATEQQGEVERRIAALAPRLDELQRTGRAGLRLAHPRFGGLDGPQWLRFLGIHTHHHLKIVRDIRRARGLQPALPRG